MNDRERKQLETAIAACHAAIEDYVKLNEMTSDQALGPPGTKEQLSELEKEWGVPLPPSYRNFMLLHDGWKNFFADLSLLSVHEMHDPKMIKSIERWRRMTRESEPEVAAAAIVIGASTPGEGSGIVYLDKRKRRPNGEMDVVSYDAEEIERARDMVSFLKTHCRTLRELIEEEEE